MFGLGVNKLGAISTGAEEVSLTLFESLFAGDEKGFLFDGSDTSSYFTDTSRTTAASIGDFVSGLTDKSGNENHLQHHSTNTRPYFARTPANGLRNIYDYGADLANTTGVASWAVVTAAGTSYGVATSDTPPVSHGGSVFKISKVSNDGSNPYIGIGTSTTQLVTIDVEHTLSFYVKLTSDGGSQPATQIAVVPAGGQYVYFNIGSVSTTSGGSWISASSVTAVGTDGWYLCSMTYTPTSLNNGNMYLVDASNSISFGNNMASILIYGLQAETGTSRTTTQHNVAPWDITEQSQDNLHCLYYHSGSHLRTPTTKNLDLNATQEVTSAASVFSKYKSSGNFSNVSGVTNLQHNAVALRHTTGSYPNISTATGSTETFPIARGVIGQADKSAPINKITTSSGSATDTTSTGSGNFSDSQALLLGTSSQYGGFLNGARIYSYLVLNRLLTGTEESDLISELDDMTGT